MWLSPWGCGLDCIARPPLLSHWGSFFTSSVADLSGRSWSFSLMTVSQSCDLGVLTGPYVLPSWPTPAWPGELGTDGHRPASAR